MSLKTEFENLKFDVRMQDINISSKMITSDQVKQQLSSLQDCSDNATKVSIDDPQEEDVEEVAANQDGGVLHSDHQGSTSDINSPQNSDYSNPSHNPYSSDNN